MPEMVKPQIIRILLVDDHPIIRQGLKSHLSSHDGVQVVGEAATGKDAIAKARELSPDIIIMDISLPDISGLEATRKLQSIVPNAKVLILTMHEDRNYIVEAVRAGARGYVLKDASPEDLITAIESVNSGGAYFHSSVSEILLDLCANDQERAKKPTPNDLTSREQEVLALIAEGCSNKEIAARLFVSVRTIECHREHITRKLDIHGTAGLTKYAITKGITKIK